MISYGDGAITDRFSPSDKLKRYEFTVTENSMSMQIYHHKKIQEYTTKCKGNEKRRLVLFYRSNCEKHGTTSGFVHTFRIPGREFQKEQHPGYGDKNTEDKEILPTHMLCQKTCWR